MGPSESSVEQTALLPAQCNAIHHDPSRHFSPKNFPRRDYCGSRVSSYFWNSTGDTMAFWSRLRQSRLIYALYHGRVGDNRQPPSRCVALISNSIPYGAQSSRFGVLNSVRFYAAPFQAKEKEDEGGIKLNEQITAPLIFLVTDQGNFEMPRHEALRRARSLKLDLVLVDPHPKLDDDGRPKPPVCKIFDYMKERYNQQLKEKERAKEKSTLKIGTLKEIRFACKITQFDLQLKADMVKKLLDRGHRVRVLSTVPPKKKRDDVPPDSFDTKTPLSRLSTLIQDVAIVESGPLTEKLNTYMVVRHVKFGRPKKGGKAKVASQNEDSDKLSHFNDAEVSVFDEEDDIDAAFDTDDEDNGLAISSKHEQPQNSTSKSPDFENMIAGISVDNPPAHASSSSSSVPKPEAQNRYAKAPPRPAGPSRIPTNMSGPDPRNMINDVPRIPYQNTPPVFGKDASSPTRPLRQAGVSSTHEVPRQDYGHTGVPHSSTQHYSIPDSHLATGIAPDRSSTEVTNRYKRNSPSDSQRGPSSPGFSPRQNFPGTDSRMSRGPNGESTGQQRSGTFDSDNPSGGPSKNHTQRR